MRRDGPSILYSVQGDCVDSLMIERLFNRPATYSRIKGDKVRSYIPGHGWIERSKGRWGINAWCVDTAVEVQSRRMYDHLDFMTSFLVANAKAVKSIMECELYESWIFIESLNDRAFVIESRELGVLSASSDKLQIYI